MLAGPSDASPRALAGRYALLDVIASGGMATVHYGLRLGPGGFSRVVAIKRLHPSLAGNPECAAMLMDEARLAARVRHPNVAAMLDVIEQPKELFLVMEYVHGEPLSRLVRAARALKERVPPAIAATIVADALAGLHAAHEATGQEREPLRIVHRDISPQNIIVGADGAARVVDFGIAKAAWRLQVTRGDQLKGKLGYMAPEQLTRDEVDRRADLWAASVVLWETLTCRRLFDADRHGEVRRQILSGPLMSPGQVVEGLPAALDAVVMRGLQRDPQARFATASEMAVALESALPRVSPREIAAWVQRVAGDTLEQRSALIEQLESTARDAVSEQVSATPLGVPPAKPRRGWVLAALGGAALLALAAALAAQRAPSSTDSSPQHEPSSASSSQLAVQPLAPSAAPSESVAPAVSSAPVRRPPRGPAAPNCTPPYTVDKLGVRVPKPACYR